MMTEGGGHEAAVHLILTHFKDDFVHEWKIWSIR
jgi:hypothetical protein